MNLNQAIIAGRVTQTPEIKSIQSGMTVAKFSLAVNRHWTDQNTKEKREAVEFINITFWGRTAEIIGQYVKKGQSLLVTGRIETQTWEGDDGKKNYRTHVVGDVLQMGPQAGDAENKRTGEEKAQGIPAKKAQPQGNDPLEVDDEGGYMPEPVQDASELF